MRNRFLSIALVICILFTIVTFPININAKEYTEGYYTYEPHYSMGIAFITDVDETICGSIEIPSTLGGCTVISIDYYAFQDCSDLTSITIPGSVEYIDACAFLGCSSLTSISVSEANKEFSTDSYGALYNKNKTCLIQYPIGNPRTSYSIPTGVTKIEGYSFSGCSSLTDITIPDSVTSIGSGAFSGCINLTSITIPGSVGSVSHKAFENCGGLLSVRLLDGVEYIGSSAFRDCSNLTSITIPDSLRGIEEYAFYGCSSLIGITIPDGVMSIESFMFYDCSSLTSVTIPDSVKIIERYAFFSCTRLSNVMLPNSITYIGETAFYNCSSLTYIRIPDTVTHIGGGAFASCSSLTSVTIPNNVTEMDCIFSFCSSITSFTIPDSVTSIEGTFNSCSNLTSIIIPDSVTSIGDWTFCGCDRLTDVYYTGSEEQWNNILIGSVNECLTNATIHYNYGSSDTDTETYPTKPSTPPVVSYMPTDINNVTINGRGAAYGRFAITNTDGTPAKNKIVYCSIEGGDWVMTKTDAYGYAGVSVKDISASKEFAVSFKGDGIQSCMGSLDVTVEPLHFKSNYEATFTKGANVAVGIGVGGSIGNLKAEAKAAEVGIDGSDKKSFGISQEYKDNKNKMTFTTKQNYSAAIKAKVGLFAEAGATDIAGIEASVGEVRGNASYGRTLGMSYEDDDFNPNDSGDVEKLARFIIAAVLDSVSSNVVTRYIVDLLDAPVNAYQKGSTATLGAGASLGVFEVGASSVKASVTLAGIDGKAVWSNNTTTNADGSKSYSSSIKGDSNIKRLSVGVKVKDGKASGGISANPFDINLCNTDVALGAAINKQGGLDSVSLTNKYTTETSIFWSKYTETDSQTITYSGPGAYEIVGTYDKLDKFASGNKGYFSTLQMANAINKMVYSDISGKYSETLEKKKGVDAELSASVQLLLKVGGKIGVSGVESYSYETKSGIYDNNVGYIQAHNDIESLVDDKFYGIDEFLGITSGKITSILSSYLEQVGGWIDDAADAVIDAGKATVKAAKKTGKKIKVGITKLIDEISAFSVLSVDSEVSLFSTSSLATTIGNPYIVSVEDEEGNMLTEFSDSPLILTLEYTDEQLAESGVTDVNDIAILRWDDDKSVYVRVGGTLDTANKCMTLEITKPGQYILATDNCPPAITEFVSGGSGLNPEISAIVSDFSGIDDFTFSVDGTELVNMSNIKDYYDFTTGEFAYATSELAKGSHTAVITAKDTFGNSIEQSIDFDVTDDVPTIDEVTKIGDILTEATSVTAKVSGNDILGVHLNMDITDPYGIVTRSTMEMIEQDGVYTAEIDEIPTGYTVNAWVNAYNIHGNSADSEKQTAVVIPCESGKGAIAITSASEGMVTVVCTDAEAQAKIILAVYDAKGKLLQVKAEAVAEEVTFREIASGKNIRAYLIDGNVKPLAADCEIVVE